MDRLPRELREDQRTEAPPAGPTPDFGDDSGPIDLSVVAPVYDEVENLAPLVEQVRDALAGLVRWELVLVDDGSRDGSDAEIRRLAGDDPRVRGVFFERNCGQTAAMAAGIRSARGELIATLDADLQNDPADLPAMLDALEDHDAVVGYREKRRDDWIRRVSSRVANRVRNWVTADTIRDTGCSLKLFRAEAIRDVPFLEGMHRFLPTLLRYAGCSVVEHAVHHRPRTAGESKYGVWNRLFRATLDMVAVRWMRSRTIHYRVREDTASSRTTRSAGSRTA